VRGPAVIPVGVVPSVAGGRQRISWCVAPRRPQYLEFAAHQAITAVFVGNHRERRCDRAGPPRQRK
jgi:hypothetical protein